MTKILFNYNTIINVYQFSPLLKSFIGEQLEDAHVFLREQIIKGDRSDGVNQIY